jgi:diguanylate cyclase (GGDEF)-like protein
MVGSGAPAGRLAPGRGAPPAAPPPLPGIHRGAAWRKLERELPLAGTAPAAGADDESGSPGKIAPAAPPAAAGSGSGLGGDEPGAADGSATVTGRSTAQLALWCEPRRLEPRDLELLGALVPQMAASLRQALLDREARQDGLTGAAVRRVLERRLFEAFSAACERGGRVAVVLCDVDRFKRINDTFGHAAGDRALAAVAGALAAAKREPDLLARYGGEEMALLLVDTDGETALGIAERLRQRVAGLELGEDDRRMKLTVSVGVAAFPEVHVKTASELLLLADEALYEAKRRGRNRCLLHVGGGRYRTARGGFVEAAEPPPEVQPPRLFA